MKDSGVEWIGEIPSHWELPNLGLMTNLQQGLQIPFSDRLFEKEKGCYEYITTKSVHNPNDPKQYVKNPKESVLCDYEDILFGRTGNTGEVVTKVSGVFHNNFFKIDFNREKILKEYFLYYLRNSRFRENILLLAGTTTIPDLNHGDFYSCKITLPPNSEQQQIVEYLDSETQLIDKTISNEERRIELLKEYRQSLISEVVTGKIKVPSVKVN
jgi:type I restriction enzyme S subunit